LGCDRLPPAPYLSNDPSDPIGVSKPIPNLCFAYGQFNNNRNLSYSLIPQNGEYDLNENTLECHFCSFRPNTQISCTSGCADISCCAIVGQKPTFSRTKFSADPLQCCLKSAVMIDDKTCDPMNRDGSAGNCKGIIKNYCNGTNLLSDQYCIEWCNTNKDLCKGIMQTRCNDINSIKYDSACRDFCLSNAGLCDTASRVYCSNNNQDSYCSCFNSPANIYRENPACQDSNCIRNGYKTNDLITLSKNGCTVMDCSIYFDLNNIGNFSFQNNNLAQTCGNKTSNTKLPDNAGSLNSTTTNLYANPDQNGKTIMSSPLKASPATIPLEEPKITSPSETSLSQLSTNDSYNQSYDLIVYFIIIIIILFFIRKILKN